MSKEEKNLKLILLQRKKKGLLTEIFYRNVLLEHFSIPLPKNKHAIPFRNLNCYKPECVYDIQEVLTFFSKSRQGSSEDLMCHFCGNRLTLNTFYVDTNLKEIYDQVWEEEIPPIVDHITIARDGSWKLELITKVDKVDKFDKEKNRNEIKKGHPEALENIKVESGGLLETIVNYEKPPQLSEFNSEDFKTLVEIFKTAETQVFDFTIHENKMTLPRADIVQLMQVEAINVRMMRIFLEYLNSMQIIEHEKYKKGRNKCWFQGVEILDYDLSRKKINYNFLNGSESKVDKKQSEQMEYDRLIFVINIDGRWVAVIVQFDPKEIFITDFLASELGSISVDEISKLVMLLIQIELGIQFQNFSSYQGSKVKFICDCGVYVLNYVYKCMNNDIVSNVKTKFSEKELFKKQLVWLFLKLALTQKNEIHFFVPPRIDDEIIHSNRHPPKKFSDVYEPDLISRKIYNKSANTSPLRAKFDKERQDFSKIDPNNLLSRPRDAGHQKMARYRNSSEEKLLKLQNHMSLNSPTRLYRNDSLSHKASYLGIPGMLPFSKQASLASASKQSKHESFNLSPFTPTSKLPPIQQPALYYPGNPLLSPISPKNYALKSMAPHRPVRIKNNPSKPQISLKYSFNNNVPEADDESNSSRLTTLFEEFGREDKEEAELKKMKSKLENILKTKIPINNLIAKGKY